MRVVRRAAALTLCFLLLLSTFVTAGEPIDLARRAVTTITGVNELQGVGMALAPAGDVNGDGVGDLLVRSDVIWGNNPLAWVVFGGSSEPIDLAQLGDRGFEINYPDTETGDMRSYDVTGISGLGDVNGDGLDDVAIGVPWADANERVNSGSVFIVHGRTESTAIDLGTPSTTVTRIDGADTNDELGVGVAAADVDGDDSMDVVVGAPFAGDELSNPGKVYVVFDGPVDLDVDLAAPFQGFAIMGELGRQAFGAAVAGAGDMNADGFEDLVIGAPSDSFRVRSGAYLVHGKASTANIDIASGFSGWRMVAPGPSSEDTGDYGHSVAGRGDFNGDGVVDVLVGAPFAAGSRGIAKGLAFVVFGASDRSDVQLDALGSAGLRVLGVEDLGGTGWAVAFHPDIEGDGRDEALIGSPEVDAFGGFETGRTDVLFGSTSTGKVDLARSATTLTYIGAEGERAGRALAVAGDFAAVGEPLIAVGGPAANGDGVFRRGLVYLVPTTAPANDFPPRSTLYSYRAYQQGQEGSYCWDGACVDRIPSVPATEPAAAGDRARIALGIEEAPTETSLSYHTGLDEFGRPSGNGVPLDHSIGDDPRGDVGHVIKFRQPDEVGPIYLVLHAGWPGDDKGEITWFFALDLDDRGYTAISSPPDSHLMTGDTRQKGLTLGYSWCTRSVYGQAGCTIADAFWYGFPRAKGAQHGAAAMVRVHDRYRPDDLVIRFYRRIERSGEGNFVSETPRGKKTVVDYRWRAVRRNGRTVAHDAVFRLPRHGEHAYFEVRGRWRYHGTAPWQFHLRFG